MEELQKTWDDIASNWHRWGPPLRPCPQDIALTRQLLTDWWSGLLHRPYTASVYMLGVTPELATMEYPFPYDLLAVDIAENMVKQVWPGDLPHTRQGMVGDWFDSKLPNTFDVILADGSFVFFDNAKSLELSKICSNSLKADGTMIVRQFVAPDTKNSIAEIDSALQSNLIRNFHELKFRVAMSLQNSSDEGVTQNAIYEAINEMKWASGNPAFSNSDWITLQFYRGKSAKLHFPTLMEYVAMFSQHFNNIHWDIPSYNFGFSCPTFALSSPVK